MMDEQQLLNFVRSGARFAVGDTVIGNEGAKRYRITHTGWTGKVVQIRGNSEIWVMGSDGLKYPVDSVNFDLYEGGTS